MTEKVQIGLILDPLPDSIPWSNRVRRALKFLLRSCRLKNVLFVDPKALERDPAWLEVVPEPSLDCTKHEPSF